MMRPMRMRLLGLLLLVVTGCADNVAQCGDPSCDTAARSHFATAIACCKRGCAINSDDCGSGERYVSTDGTLGSCVDRYIDCVQAPADLATADLAVHDLAIIDENVPVDFPNAFARDLTTD
jgi:hypothetical protein